MSVFNNRQGVEHPSYHVHGPDVSDSHLEVHRALDEAMDKWRVARYFLRWEDEHPGGEWDEEFVLDLNQVPDVLKNALTAYVLAHSGTGNQQRGVFGLDGVPEDLLPEQTAYKPDGTKGVL